MHNPSVKPAAALFRSISDQGSELLFSILADERWAITRDGVRIASGEGRGASLDAAVRKFRLMMNAPPILPANPGKRLRADLLVMS